MLDILRHLTLASGVAWILVSLAPILARHRLTAPLWAFVLAAALVGSSALLDWILLTAGDPSLAPPLFRARLTALGLAALSFLFFAKWTVGGRGRWDGVLAWPMAGTLYIPLTLVATGVSLEPWGPLVSVDLSYYAVWIAEIFLYGGVALAYLVRGARILMRRDPRLGRQTLLFVAFMALVFVIGMVTNVLSRFTASPGFPYFSAILILPALLLLGFMALMPRERMMAAWRPTLWGGERRVLAACLMDREGNIVGLAARAGKDMASSERLAGYLATIDAFISTAFRTRLDTLRTVVAEDITYVISRGRKFFLVLAIEGKFQDYVRIEVREAIRQLERLERTTEEPPGDDAVPTLEISSFLKGLVRPGDRGPDILDL